MTTIYTVNNKVLKNSVNDKWLIKAVPPVPSDEVQIGNQIWKTKNLAIDDGQGGIYTQTVNYGQGDVTEYYYTWDAALRVAAAIEGWHIPTLDEWNTLAYTVSDQSTAGTKLKSTYGWSSGNGTDDFGFAAFPAGYRYSDGSFYEKGLYAYFWTATDYTTSRAKGIFFNTSAGMGSSNLIKTNGDSVRLVKDAV